MSQHEIVLASHARVEKKFKLLQDLLDKRNKPVSLPSVDLPLEAELDRQEALVQRQADPALMQAPDSITLQLAIFACDNVWSLIEDQLLANASILASPTMFEKAWLAHQTIQDLYAELQLQKKELQDGN